jgi:hypothetical protein
MMLYPGRCQVMNYARARLGYQDDLAVRSAAYSSGSDEACRPDIQQAGSLFESTEDSCEAGWLIDVQPSLTTGTALYDVWSLPTAAVGCS